MESGYPAPPGRPDERRERSILDQIAQDARIQRSARMLPDRPLTADEVNQIALDFARWLRESKRTLLSVSKALGRGFSQPTLSQFLNPAKRAGDVETVARGLAEYMERESRTAEAQRPDGFVETLVAKRILAVVRTAVETRSIGVVVGPAGVGKTLTAKAAASLYTGSIYLRVTQSEKRVTGLIASLARTLGTPQRQGSANTHRLVIEHLRGSGRPILVDEAHALTTSAIDGLRDIHDEAGVPVILFGTNDVRRQVDDTQQWYGQLTSRIVATCDIGEIAASGPRGRSKPLFTVEEIRKIFSSDKLRLTGDGAQFLCELANVAGLGGLRICAKIMDLAMRVAEIRAAGSVGADHLRRICKQMHGASYMEMLSVRRVEVSAAPSKAVSA